jgi:hypothetical protein
MLDGAMSAHGNVGDRRHRWLDAQATSLLAGAKWGAHLIEKVSVPFLHF